MAAVEAHGTSSIGFRKAQYIKKTDKILGTIGSEIGNCAK